eukprot:7344372-Karenia_brevis.AAC.1
MRLGVHDALDGQLLQDGSTSSVQPVSPPEKLLGEPREVGFADTVSCGWLRKALPAHACRLTYTKNAGRRHGLDAVSLSPIAGFSCQAFQRASICSFGKTSSTTEEH